VAGSVADDGGQPPDAASDEDLARRVQRGDAYALEQLVRRYVRAVYAVVASYLSTPEDVEDASQETFLRALRGIGRYDPERPFAPWLYEIARNVARNHSELRARWRMDPTSDSLQSALPQPDVALERAEIRSEVNAAIARLPEQQRTAFRLCDVEGYATEDAARIMGLSPGTVRSHVHHARRALRAALGARMDPAENTGD
jgi:RNA polymerase sigma-70 factor (ECF subfamily)